MMSMRGTELLLIVSFLVLGVLVTTTFGANVTYDNRALVIDGNRRVLISGSIHYPRSTPDMWPDLIQKSKDGGLDVIETYVFWNLHEPVRNQYDFEGGKDLVKFVKLVAAAGLYVHIRIGPYVCAEWNYGGFPLWLHFIPGIEFRTDNEPFKAEMKRFTAKIVDMMKQENLYASQGGPIILSQIENEYGNIDSAYGSAAKTYINWAASMATSLDTGVPWVMCQQADAPDPIINTCNGFYCDQFTPNSANKPKMWTENWTGWFLSFGGAVPYRPVEDIAFAVARFFQRGGTFQNYYMYHGGTNFGRTTGGPFIATSYDYDAPIDEYGLLRQPKWGHLKDVHKAIKLCEPAMVATGPTITSLGPNLEAGVYKTGSGLCAAFLANVDTQSDATVNFNGNSYNLPAWSVSILPDCKNVVLNTAKVGVDNMCILVHAVKRQPQELPLEGRISNALVEVGPSITLASLSEVLAFAVGSFISMPACRVFSMFAALAVLLDFLLQVTAFVALIVFDILRAEDNRVDCFPCLKVPSSSVESVEVVGNQRSPGLLARYMEEVHARVLSLWGVKVVVIAVFTAFALASIALCTRIEPGLEQQIALPRDSYLQGYFNDVSEYLRIGPPLYFVVKDYNYSSESRHTNQLCSISQCDANSLLSEISRASLMPESTHIAKPAASWLDDFLVWMSPEAFGCCRKFVDGSYCPPDDQPPCCSPDEDSCDLDGICKDCTTCFLHSDLDNGRPSTAQFKEKLPWFLNALPSADCAKGGHGAYTSSVDLNGYESGVIRASEFRTYHTPLRKQDDFVNSMRAAREFSSRVSDSLKIEIFPYSVFYIFFEQYLDIWETAVINIAIALGAVFLVCLVITSSLWSSAIIVLVLAMIVVDLLGVMAILDIQLNAVSVVNLIMSIGIAVEFCVHISHAFSVSHGDRSQRAKEALRTMGSSVFSGITLTKLVGVIVLYFAKSEIFVVYYFQMYLALVIIGFLHGLVFLPVVLSMFGPPSRSVPIEREQELETSTLSHLTD